MNPTSLSTQYNASRCITAPLVQCMNTHTGILGESLTRLKERKCQIRGEQQRTLAHCAIEFANAASRLVQRHNEVRDLTVRLLDRVAHDVTIKPSL